ncbi:MAG: nucleoside deaminase [Propionibacteriaceae bacterium]
MITDQDLPHLRRCIALATAAVEAGDEPFGSVLVAADGAVLAEEHNHAITREETQHPEFALARWAGEHLTAPERATATVYTSGEHCPMCSAAHAWVGLGRIAYVASSTQLTGWLTEWGVPAGPVRPLTINEIAPGLVVDGPAPELDQEMREIHRAFHSRR